MNRPSVFIACAFLMAFAVQKAEAQSARAYERANCNASFLNDCEGESSPSISTGPAPALGGFAAGVLVGGLAWRTWRNRKADGPLRKDGPK